MLGVSVKNFEIWWGDDNDILSSPFVCNNEYRKRCWSGRIKKNNEVKKIIIKFVKIEDKSDGKVKAKYICVETKAEDYVLNVVYTLKVFMID